MRYGVTKKDTAARCASPPGDGRRLPRHGGGRGAGSPHTHQGGRTHPHRHLQRRRPPAHPVRRQPDDHEQAGRGTVAVISVPKEVEMKILRQTTSGRRCASEPRDPGGGARRRAPELHPRLRGDGGNLRTGLPSGRGVPRHLHAGQVRTGNGGDPQDPSSRRQHRVRHRLLLLRDERPGPAALRLHHEARHPGEDPLRAAEPPGAPARTTRTSRAGRASAASACPSGASRCR